MKKHFYLLLMIFCFVRVSTAQPGSLDLSFNGTGKVTTDFGGNADVATGITIQTDGKIVVVGTSFNGSHHDFALARYNPDGSLDNSFNSTGKVITDFSGADDFASAVALQSNGKIVVAGYSYSNFGFALARYNHDGSLDNSFDVDGKVLTDFGTTPGQAFSIAIQADGKIVVAGSIRPAVFPFLFDDLAIARYNPDGSLDTDADADPATDFDFDGKLTIRGDAVNVVYAMAIQSDGKILLALSTNNLVAFGYRLARLNPDGSFDNTFDADGQTSRLYFSNAIGPIGPEARGQEARGIALTSDGKIVVGGWTGYADGFGPTPSDFGLARFNTDASPDPGFTNGGQFRVNMGSATDIAKALSLQKDGKIILAGDILNGSGNRDAAVARFNADGSLDGSFDGDGKAFFDLLGTEDTANAMALFADRIYIAGSAGIGALSDFSLIAIKRCNSVICGVAVSPNPVVAGHPLNTIYLGYGPQSVTLSASMSGGSGPLEADWGSAGTGSSINVSPTVTTIYTLRVTDADGCSCSSSVTVNVVDIRCGKNKLERLVCHKESTTNKNTLCISPNAIATHLAHGDVLGGCSNLITMSKGTGQELNAAGHTGKGAGANLSLLRLYPNPGTNQIQLQWRAEISGVAAIKIVDILGRTVLAQTVMETRGDNYRQVSLQRFKTGQYYLMLKSGKKTRTANFLIQH